MSGRFAICTTIFLLFLVWPDTADAQACDFTAPEDSVLFEFPLYTSGQGTAVGDTASISVACGGIALLFNIDVFIDGGNTMDVFDRRMSNGTGGELSYDIRTTLIAGTTIGNGEPGTTSVTISCLAALLGLNVCVSPVFQGLVFAGQYVPGGVYSDSVTIRIEF